jgi:hypothetical protein
MKPHRASNRKVITPEMFLRAIEGTYGALHRVAEALHVSRSRAKKLLYSEGPGWDKVRLAFEEECDRIVEKAEDTVRELVDQREDLPEAGRNARWILEKRKAPVYGDTKKVVLEGGKNPLKVESTAVDVDLDALPVEVQRALLAQLEGPKEEEKQEGK